MRFLQPCFILTPCKGTRDSGPVKGLKAEQNPLPTPCYVATPRHRQLATVACKGWHSTALSIAQPKSCSCAGLSHEMLFSFSSIFPIAKHENIAAVATFRLSQVTQDTMLLYYCCHTGTATLRQLWPLTKGQRRLCYITLSWCSSPAHHPMQPPSSPAALQRSPKLKHCGTFLRSTKIISKQLMKLLRLGENLPFAPTLRH